MINLDEFKKQYKLTPLPMGVYQIRNMVNGKIFIGTSKDVRARINRHKFALETGIEEIKPLLLDYQKYGAENFSFEVLDLLEPKEDMPGYDYTEDIYELGLLWLEKLQPYDERGYNVK
ncbi:MAG: GIY-YIG nuclease family protein [Ignavibacteria bacterium]|nr:GIY-YIG nuclease family protein [Ignavibacteria bacterium]